MRYSDNYRDAGAHGRHTRPSILEELQVNRGFPPLCFKNRYTLAAAVFQRTAAVFYSTKSEHFRVCAERGPPCNRIFCAALPDRL